MNIVTPASAGSGSSRAHKRDKADSLASRLATWRAAAESPLNIDAVQIQKAAAELREMVEQFLVEHDHEQDEEPAAGIIADMRGFAWAIDMFVGLLDSQVLPHPDDVLAELKEGR